MFRLARKVLCLDWDKRSLRMLVARVGPGSFSLLDAHAQRIATGVDCEDPQGMGQFIAGALAEKRIRQRRVCVDVPRDKVVPLTLNIPPTPSDELAAAVRFRAMKELSFPLEEAQIDFVVLRRDEQGLAVEVLLVAIRQETLDRIVATCRAAGLNPVRVGLRPYANLIAVRSLPAFARRRVLFVDVGPAVTEIGVFRAGVFAFSRWANVSVPFSGGELMTDESRVSAKAALSERVQSEEFESSAVGELAIEIARTLQAYRATDAEALVEQIVIAGGTGVEPALAQAVEQRLKLPASLFDPTGALGVAAHEATKLRAFSAVLGLAWGMAREADLEVDFLNPKRPIPRSHSLRRRLRVSGWAAAALLALVGGYTARAYLRLAARIAELEKEVDPNTGTLSRAARELAELDVRTLEAADWEREARLMVWLDHLLRLTRAAVEPGKQMLVRSVDFTSGSAAAITLRVTAENIDVANRFVEQLNEIEVDGRRPYRARLDVWNELRQPEGRLRGEVTVIVELRAVREAFDPKSLKERERDRKRLFDL